LDRIRTVLTPDQITAIAPTPPRSRLAAIWAPRGNGRAFGGDDQVLWGLAIRVPGKEALSNPGVPRGSRQQVLLPEPQFPVNTPSA